MIQPFILKEEENGLIYYRTEDEKFHVIERPDSFFLLYQLNREDDCYDWTETYHPTLDDCIKEMNTLQ